MTLRGLLAARVRALRRGRRRANCAVERWFRTEGGWIRLKLLLQTSQALPIIIGFAALVAAPLFNAGTTLGGFFMLAFTLLLLSTVAFFAALALFTVFVPRKIAYHDNLEAFVAATLSLRDEAGGPTHTQWVEAKIDAWDASNFDQTHPLHRRIRRGCWALLASAAGGLALTSVLFVLLLIVRLFD